MKNKIHSIHFIVGFGLLFLVPIAQRIDYHFGEISKFLAIGYWGLVALGFFIILIKDSLAEYGLKRCLFNLWLFLSLLSGGVGLYTIIMEGLDDAPWAIWFVIYGSLVGYIYRSKLK
jgi:hypothetical protein